MAFRDLVAEIDSVVFDTLADVGYIEGRRVLGMFSAPWLQPKVGRLNTGLRDPCFHIRVVDAQGVEKTQTVHIELPVLDGGGEYTLTHLEPAGDGLVALSLRLKA
ncbi:hypothetical protein BOO88_16540 [Stutzerimonas stutzeri]|nr:hypothetical protein BOO89_02360 [Stutzerimonas stutzeri]AZO90447.1 hypothetical protein BOO88_16540 [Stutzerimonas stutzeri]